MYDSGGAGGSSPRVLTGCKLGIAWANTHTRTLICMLKHTHTHTGPLNTSLASSTFNHCLFSQLRQRFIAVHVVFFSAHTCRILSLYTPWCLPTWTADNRFLIFNKLLGQIWKPLRPVYVMILTFWSMGVSVWHLKSPHQGSQSLSTASPSVTGEKGSPSGSTGTLSTGGVSSSTGNKGSLSPDWQSGCVRDWLAESLPASLIFSCLSIYLFSGTC